MTLPPAPQGATARGILMMLGACLMFSSLDAVAKHLTAHYPAMQVVWARFFGQTLLIMLWLNRRLGPALRTRRPGLQFLRSVLQLSTGLLFFLSLKKMGLVEASAIADTSPVLITLGAALFLGERIGPRRLFGVLAALVGALVIIRPGTDVFSPWAFLPLAAAVAYAGFALATRKLGPGEGVASSILLAGLLGTLILTAALPLFWVPVRPGDLWAFVLIGALGTAAQAFIVRAFTLAPASAIAPFSYAGLIFATFWGYAAFGEVPDAATVAGALVIVVAGLYVWHRETRAPGVRRTGA